MAVIVVSLLIENELAGFAPKFTAVTYVKPVPVKVTIVPPAAGPRAGLIGAVNPGTST
jgi:hypothetical protein